MYNSADTSRLTDGLQASQEHKVPRLKRITWELIKCCAIISIPSLIAGFTLVSADAIYQPMIRFLRPIDTWHKQGIVGTNSDFRGYLHYMYRIELPLFRLQKALLAGFAILGALLAKYLLSGIGRARTHNLQYLLALVGWSITLIALFFDFPIVFLLARSVLGLHMGLVSVCVPIYLNEVSHIATQGICGCFHYLFALIGVLFAYVFGVSNVMFDTPVSNYVILAMSLYPILFAFFGAGLNFYMLPESPKYLYIVERDVDACKRVLVSLRRDKNVELELEALRNESAAYKAEDTGFFASIRSNRQLLSCAVGLQLIHQLCNITGDFVFSVVYHELELPYFKGAAILYCIVQIFSVLMCIAFIELLGRKLLLIYSVLIVGCYNVIQAITTVSEIAAYLAEYNMFIVAASCGLICIIFNGIGVGPIAYLYPTELFDFQHSVRAVSICMACNWFFHSLFQILFSQLYLFMEFYAFLMLGACIIVIFIFLIRQMPETRFRMRYEYFMTTAQHQHQQQ